MGDLGSIFLLALGAMFNPTLLAAVTLMMLMPRTKELMFGYLLGAYLASITLGMLVVYSLHGSGSVQTAQHSLTPVEDLVLGALALIVGFVLRSGRDERLRERRRRRRAEKHGGEPERKSWPERMLGRGSARVSFAVGVALSLPGVSYLAALDLIAKQDVGRAETALLVLAVCLIQQALLELPLLGYLLAPEWTQGAVERFRAWLGRNARRLIARGAFAVGGLLVLRGAIELIAQ
ncbi:MAG TPA: GAP family protein [Solirubrobacterales bacterium]|nr:GAP family protein [Solirubrobacterales bacterium]